MSEFAAVAIEGARAVGKTESAIRRARSVHRLDGPEATIAAAEPTAVLSGDPPVLIDEWQYVPPVWDAVRRAVDAGATPGSYVLTGSASEHGAHTGAGRILSLRMRPMTLAERGIATPTVGLGTLLAGGRPAVAGSSTIGLEGYAAAIIASGFPGARALSPRARQDFLDSYLTRIVEHDFAELGHAVRRAATLRRWMIAYAAATSTTASFETIRDAASGGEGNKPAKTTTLPYREILERLFVVDPVPAWAPTRSRMARLAMPPKHQLADPALAASLLGVDAAALLSAEPAGPPIPRDGVLLGALFESLVTLDVRVFAEAARARVGHLRTRSGDHEIDLIVERRDGRVLAIEVKLTSVPSEQDLRHLHWLRNQIGEDLLDAVVVVSGPTAYRRPDGIAVVPAALLGP